MNMLLILFICSMLSFNLFAQEQSAAVPKLQDVTQAYQTGDYNNAIELCDQLIKSDPRNTQAKNLLVEILVAASEEAYILDRPEDAYAYLNRAMEVAPNSEMLNVIYEKFKKKREQKAQEAAPVASMPSDIGSFYKLIEKTAQAQKDVLSQTQKSMQKMAEQTQKTAAEEKQLLMQSLEKRENQLTGEIRFGRKYSIGLIVGATALGLLAIVLIIYLIEKSAKRREEILFQQSGQFVQLIQEQSGKSLEFMAGTVGLLSQNITRPSVPLLDHQTNEKLRRIDVIDAEIIQEGKSLTEKDSDVLRSLLEDTNPSVRARTIQVFLKYNPEEAFQQIEALARGSKKEERLLAAEIMGGIANQKSISLLLQMLEDPDSMVKRQAISALHQLIKEIRDRDQIQDIEQALAIACEKEGWVIT